MTLSEQRQFNRLHPVHGKPIRVDINGANFIDILPARDISEGGIGFDVSHEFKGCDIDEEVRLIISLPTSPAYAISVSAKIHHMTAQTFGASFIGLASKDRDALRSFIGSLG